MPSSVKSRSQTIGFLAFGFSEKPASGSSFGSSTMPVSSEAIFISASPLCRLRDLLGLQHRQPLVGEVTGLSEQLCAVLVRRLQRLAVLEQQLAERGDDQPGRLGPILRCLGAPAA